MYLARHLTMHWLGNLPFEMMQWNTLIHDVVWHTMIGTVNPIADKFSIACD